MMTDTRRAGATTIPLGVWYRMGRDEGGDGTALPIGNTGFGTGDPGNRTTPPVDSEGDPRDYEDGYGPRDHW